MKTENKAVLVGGVYRHFKGFTASCAERMTKISQGSIGDCLHGRRKTAGGYLWQYEK